jgi:hypothetical protein
MNSITMVERGGRVVSVTVQGNAIVVRSLYGCESFTMGAR